MKRRCLTLALICGLAILTVSQAVARDIKSSSATQPQLHTGTEKRHENMNKRVAEGNVDLIFIGDSITEAWETAGKDVWAKNYGTRNAVNLGISGDRTQHVLWRLDHGNIDGIKPKLAVIMIGTNNSNNKDNTAEEIGEGITAIVEKLRTKLPDTKVLILGIFPRGEKPNPQREKNAQANEIAAKLADNKKVFYLDIGSKFLSADGTLSKDIMPDFLHLTPQGYEIWASAIDSKVAELMGEKRPNAAAVPMPREDSWWTERQKALNARIAQGKVDLVFIGDSITQGWEGNGKDAWAKAYAKRNAANLGIGGDGTQHVLWRLDHGNLDGIKPKLAVLMIGTNNSGGNAFSGEEIGAGITAIVDRLRSKLPDTKVLILGVFPRGEKPNPQREKNAKASEVAAKLADNKNVFYLDIGPKFLAADGTLSKDIMPDLLHLSPKGYDIWVSAIEDKVSELMGEKK